MRIVYSPQYNISFFGIERLHPFDSRKYGRAWRELKRRFGSRLSAMRLSPPRAAAEDDLLRVHSPQYLEQLRQPAYVAGALELPIVRRMPAWLLDRQVLRPMRWATMGTVVAARAALEHGLAVNLSGGYHHAKPARGEGFCIYSDVALAVAVLRDQQLSPEDRFVHIDLDAHQGNGVCYQFREDRRAFLFDMFNGSIYPSADRPAIERIDCSVRLRSGCGGSEYLGLLRAKLPGFLDSLSHPVPRIAFYNAGTDVYEGDMLGDMRLTANEVLARDLYVIEQLRERNLPAVMLLSGGYSQVSYQLVASSIAAMMERNW